MGVEPTHQNKEHLTWHAKLFTRGDQARNQVQLLRQFVRAAVCHLRQGVSQKRWVQWWGGNGCTIQPFRDGTKHGSVATGFALGDEIFNGITPDGDNLNDFFNIFGIENYPDNNVKIYNRWGVLVFETDGYGGSNGQENVFRGISEARATIRESEELPTGTYYYVLKIISDDPPNGKSDYSGYLYINR